MYEVQTKTFLDGWVNCWNLNDKPHFFDTRKEAQEELDDFLQTVKVAVEMGAMMENYERDDYRIIKLEIEN
tara:strand:+ start:1021 stop:1233 length:213 start_codon:yes stop_codon:yes gene_type:complete